MPDETPPKGWKPIPGFPHHYELENWPPKPTSPERIKELIREALGTAKNENN